MTTLPHQRHSRTSREAATLFEQRATNLRGDVFMHIRQAGARGLTDNEGIARSGIGGSTWRPRRVELARLGMIVPKGGRKGKNGRKSTVWVGKEWA